MPDIKQRFDGFTRFPNVTLTPCAATLFTPRTTAARVVSSSMSLSITNVFPACARARILALIDRDFGGEACSRSSPLVCFCSHAGNDGSTFGEAASAAIATECPLETLASYSWVHGICDTERSGSLSERSLLTTGGTVAITSRSPQDTSFLPTAILPPNIQTSTITGLSTADAPSSVRTSATSTTGSSSPSTTSKAAAGTSSAGQLSTAGIVGIAAAGIAACAVTLGFLVFLCLLRRKERRKTEKERLPYSLEKPLPAPPTSGQQSLMQGLHIVCPSSTPAPNHPPMIPRTFGWSKPLPRPQESRETGGTPRTDSFRPRSNISASDSPAELLPKHLRSARQLSQRPFLHARLTSNQTKGSEEDVFRTLQPAASLSPSPSTRSSINPDSPAFRYSSFLTPGVPNHATAAHSKHTGAPTDEQGDPTPTRASHASLVPRKPIARDMPIPTTSSNGYAAKRPSLDTIPQSNPSMSSETQFTSSSGPNSSTAHVSSSTSSSNIPAYYTTPQPRELSVLPAMVQIAKGALAGPRAIPQRPPKLTLATRTSSNSSAGQMRWSTTTESTTFESPNSADTTPPEEMERTLAPIHESPLTAKLPLPPSPISGLRYPKIPRPSNLAIPRRGPSLLEKRIGKRNARDLEKHLHITTSQGRTSIIDVGSLGSPLFRVNTNTKRVGGHRKSASESQARTGEQTEQGSLHASADHLRAAARTCGQRQISLAAPVCSKARHVDPHLYPEGRPQRPRPYGPDTKDQRSSAHPRGRSDSSLQQAERKTVSSPVRNPLGANPPTASLDATMPRF